MRVFKLLIAWIVFLAFMSACNGSGTDPDEATVTPNYFDIGDVSVVDVENKRYEIMVDNVKKVAGINGGVPENDAFIIVRVVYKNVSEEEISVEEINKGVLISGDDTVKSNITETNLINLKKGRLSPGQSITRNMLFDHVDSTSYIIQFTEGVAYEIKINQ